MPDRKIRTALKLLASVPAAAGLTDAKLLERFAQQHDEAAFTALVRRHGPMVLGVCRRVLGPAHDAEDAFQAAFLVLARKASSIKRRQAVGSWLHGVAHRVALKARTALARRRLHERQAGTMRLAEGATEAAANTLESALEEELQQLPEKYRAPLVLCYLEGRTQLEVARELGWPIGSMNWRLAEARDRLRERLTQRGLALATGGVAVGLSAAGVQAAVSPALVDSTVKGAILFGAGNAALAPAVSADAVAWAEGVLRSLSWSRVKFAAVLALVIGLVGSGIGAGWVSYRAWVADVGANKTGTMASAIVLPKDPKAVVVSMRITGGMIRNVSPDPSLQIQADGKVTLTDRITGARKESMLTPAELQDLLRFVIQESDFFNTDRQNSGGFMTDGTTTTIRVHANNQEHEASGYMASAGLKNNPNVNPRLARYTAVEWRLNQLGYLMELAPVAGDANAGKRSITLPKDPNAVVLSMSVSHKKIETRKVVRPNGGVSIFQGSPRADQVLQIRADGKVIVANRVSGDQKKAALTALQLQDVLRFVIQENDFCNQSSVRLPEKDNPDARKLVISVHVDDKQHEVSMEGRSAAWTYKDQMRSSERTKLGSVYAWLDNLARTYVWPSGSCWEY